VQVFRKYLERIDRDKGCFVRALAAIEWREFIFWEGRMTKIIRALVGLASLGLVFSLPASAQAPKPIVAALFPLPAQPKGVPFPTKQWARGPLPDGTKEAELASAVENAIAGRTKALGQTRAVVIVQGGKVVLERYATGWGAESTHVSWSVAKSITSALVGIAVRDKVLSVDDPVDNPAWKVRRGDLRAKITFRHTLGLSDGLRWRETDVASIVDSDAAKMLFGEGRNDPVKWAAERPLEHRAGTSWRYSTGSFALAAAGIAQRLPPAKKNDLGNRIAMREFMRQELFVPLGMTSAAPEFDAAGNFYGGSLVYATALDYARFGLLYLRDGKWDGKQILPPGWVDFSRTPTSATNVDAYGHGWWLSNQQAGKGGFLGSTPLLTKGPFDSFEAQGRFGQIIAVVPSKDLVVVRLGQTEGAWKELGDWTSAVVNSFPDVALKQPEK
jgi:CubicO group peptidase (beta-lactamase class C family)